MTKKRNTTTDGVKILYQRYVEGRPEMLKLLEIERANLDIARKIYDLRTNAGLSQRELAKLVGTQPSAISRLEDADYGGHSLNMLQRIAVALNKKMQVRFVPLRAKRKSASSRGA